jgi:hypothetical protein
MTRISVWRTLGCAILAISLETVPARAQLNGENLLGDTGIKSGTQPAPGFYAGVLYYRYDTDTIRDGDGDRVILDPTQAASQVIQSICPLFFYVSDFEVLGGNYGIMAVMPFANGVLEAPGFDLVEEASTAAGDLYLVPLQLGWHFPRADATVSLALFAPTGRYTAGADDNIGKGMWSYELSAGTTLFLDEARTWSLATSGFWEIHSKKEGEIEIGNLTLSDAKVGQLLTLEGGVGKSFLRGAAHAGLAYYAQWKITDDDFGLPIDPPGGAPIKRHRVYGLGPDVTIPIAIRSRLISILNVRYLWETGARVKTEGESLLISATFPVPSMRIPPEGHDDGW